MKKLDFDMTYFGIDLWVSVSAYEDGDFEIDKVGYYAGGGICKSFDWEEAFDYDHFIDTVYDAYNRNMA